MSFLCQGAMWNDLSEEPGMNLQEAADRLDLTKKKLWRAVKAETLQATRKQVGNRWEYRVTPEALEAYRQEYLVSRELRAVPTERPGTTVSADADTAALAELESKLALAEAERNDLERKLVQAETDAAKARAQAKEASVYLKEARTVIQGWEARRKKASFWQRVLAQ